MAKASGHPVNAIIPDDRADLRLPKLKLTDVTAPDVFQALELATQKVVTIGPINSPQSRVNTSIGFRQANGVSTGDPVWFFRCEGCDLAKPVPIPSTIQVFSLTRFLGKPDQGLHSVEDITTAIHTGWKMQQIDPMPELSYHKETQLLIAVGPAQQLTLIADVLKQLEPTSSAPAAPKSK